MFKTGVSFITSVVMTVATPTLEAVTLTAGAESYSTSPLSFQAAGSGAFTGVAPLALKAFASASLDIDGSGQPDALTDGVLIVRHLFGLTGDALVAGVTAPTATRTSAADIASYLASISALLDVDGNGRVDALTDGLLIVRYLFGLRGAALTDGAIGSGATRASSDSIETWVASLVGTSATSDVGYATTFGGTENPISESGRWIGGLTAGLDWNNVQTVPGKAFATVISGNPNRYNDSIAQLVTPGFAANQYAQGTVYRAAGYSPSGGHEVELLLRFQITPHNARGYEVLWGHRGNLAIVRWNGPLASFVVLYDSGIPGIGPAVDGDVLRAEIVGSTIRVYRNGAMVASVSDSTWTTGQPGIGFWPVDGATIQNYGWKNYQAGNL